MGTSSALLLIVTTLVLTPRYTDDSQLLWRAAGRIGWHVERLQTWRVPDHLRNLEDPMARRADVLNTKDARFRSCICDICARDLVSLRRVGRCGEDEPASKVGCV
jgi:hypothetical protein